MFIPHNFIYVCFMRPHLSEIFCISLTLSLSLSLCLFSVLLMISVIYFALYSDSFYGTHIYSFYSFVCSINRDCPISIPIMLEVSWQADKNEFWWLDMNVCKIFRQQHQKCGQMNISVWLTWTYLKMGFYMRFIAPMWPNNKHIKCKITYVHITLTK